MWRDFLPSPQSGREELETEVQEFDSEQDGESPGEDSSNAEVRHYAALGSDNCWYMFTGKSVKSVHRNGSNFGAPLAPGEKPMGEILKEKLRLMSRSWQNLGRTGLGLLSSVWSAESSMDTWAWGCQVPLLSELSGAHEVLESLDVVVSGGLYKSRCWKF